MLETPDFGCKIHLRTILESAWTNQLVFISVSNREREGYGETSGRTFARKITHMEKKCACNGDSTVVMSSLTQRFTLGGLLHWKVGRRNVYVFKFWQTCTYIYFACPSLVLLSRRLDQLNIASNQAQSTFPSSRLSRSTFRNRSPAPKHVPHQNTRVRVPLPPQNARQIRQIESY
jgi:hypothetical protein